MNASQINTLIGKKWKCGKCGKVGFESQEQAEYCCSLEQKKAAELEDIRKNGLTCGGDE